ncbi:MAG: NorD protein [Crocinitomicaceae bacterium]|nr:NorD protein [Crocinitomicaceae bacterium]|tara:strand:+ start:5282 stop:7051 length:1770 start_codon:yes stop_codon:yes gene_type:complete
MEFDQLIFRRIYNYYAKKLSKSDPERESRAVHLSTIKPRLTILARALTGIPNEILTSEREGGFSGSKFYLPKKVDFFSSREQNLNFYVFRVLYLSVQQQQELNWKDNEEHKIAESQQQAYSNSKLVLESLFKEYPSTQTIHTDLYQGLTEYYKSLEKSSDYSWLYGRYMKLNPHEFVAKTDRNTEEAKSKLEPNEITTELEANASDEVTTVGLNKKQIEDNVVTNNFEKVETLSEFNGNFREMDGDDTLSDDEDAIRELNLKHTVRTDDSAHSVYRAEMAHNTSDIFVESDSQSGQYLYYDEWNYKNRQYKKDFCKVYPKTLSIKREDFAINVLKQRRKTKNELFRMFVAVHNEFEKVNRVISGEDIDLDNMVEFYTDLQAKKSPSDKVYFSKRKRKKDLSVLILMDTSLSSDGYTNNEHVLTVEKESVLLFGEILSAFDIPFQIDTFSSKTRNNCSYNHVKTFRENWVQSRNRIGAIQAEGFTRIGTALRHAGHLVKQQPTKRKWIVLLSDGKPNDYDTYEGKYGIEDVKQTLRELDQDHIHTFSFAVEHQAKYYLPQMFGHNNYNILPKPSDLPLAFSKFYRKILNN